MKNFTYYRPATAEQAVRLLAPQWGATELLAGGTDLLDRQKQYISQPDKVISLGGIKGEMDGAPPGLTGVRLEKGKGDTITGVTIGARTTLADIAGHAQLRALFPALTEAAGNIAGPQTRNMATLGGSLCQRNRCWYFRDEAVKCLLKGGDRCFALDGENQYHAIFTQGHKCVIASPTSLGPALIALDAQAHILGPQGPRDLDLSKFFHAPTSEAEREHVLAPNEILLSVHIPNRESRSSSYEVRHKLSSDWPLVQAAVAFSLQDGKAGAVRIVLGQVAPTPYIAADAAKVLEGQPVTEETAARAAAAAVKDAKPLNKNGYKVKLTEVAVKRALLTAAGQKKYWEV